MSVLLKFYLKKALAKIKFPNSPKKKALSFRKERKG